MANIKQIVNGNVSGATIEFTSNDLVTLSNALCAYLKNISMNESQKNLRDIIHIASQISQYGHMDIWAVSVLSCQIDKDE